MKSREDFFLFTSLLSVSLFWLKLYLRPFQGLKVSCFVPGPSLCAKRPAHFVDLSKPKHSRIQRNIKLGHDSPDDQPKSLLDFDRGSDRTDRVRGFPSRLNEDTETPLPRSLLEKRINEAEKRFTRNSKVGDKFRGNVITDNANTQCVEGIATQEEKRKFSGRALLETKGGGNGRPSVITGAKRYFPQKPKTKRQDGSFTDSLEVNALRKLSKSGGFLHSSPLQHEGLETGPFLSVIDKYNPSQTVPSSVGGHRSLQTKASVLEQWGKSAQDRLTRDVFPHEEESLTGPFLREKSKFELSVDSGQHRPCFEVISRCKIEDEEYLPFLSQDKGKRFPTGVAKKHDVASPQLDHIYRWNSGELVACQYDDSKSGADDFTKKRLYDDHHINETSLQLSKDDPNENLVNSGITDQQPTLDSRFLNGRNSSVIVRNCRDGHETGLAVPPYLDSVKEGHYSGSDLRKENRFPDASNFSTIEKFGKLEDDSEEDRFRQEMFKQRPYHFSGSKLNDAVHHTDVSLGDAKNNVQSSRVCQVGYAYRVITALDH